MHHSLKSYYRRLALLAEIVLLSASVVFLLTTFADTNLYDSLNLPTDLSKIILGLASAATFLSSLILLLLDWPGKAASHKDSADRWYLVLTLFRDARTDDKAWPLEMQNRLSSAYANVCDNSVDIPSSKFNSLKVKYLTKVEIGKMAEKHPGAPRFLLSLCVKYRAIKKVISKNE